MAKPRLLIFDLDGTALGGHEPYAQFPPDFAAFLDDWAAHGMLWATATTWDVALQWEAIQRSELESRPVMLTGQSGRQAGVIVDGAVAIDIPYQDQVTAADHRFRQRWWPEVRRIFQALLDEDLVDRLAFDSVPGQCLVELTARPDCEPRVGELIAPLLCDNGYYTWTREVTSRMMLLPCHMSKAPAVRHIQQHTKVLPSETIIAGDGCNDLPMFSAELAAWHVAPANVDPTVRRHLASLGGIVAEQSYSWGVVEALKSILGSTCEGK